MEREEMKRRTKQFALRIIKLCNSLPKDKTSDVIRGQLIRAGTSVGSNYRAACRAKSNADFLYKLKIVEEEADESLYWMELLIEAELVEQNRLLDLMEEGDEIIALVVSSIKTARKNK
ncbi:MAG: four helix bundle protein [bacterium]